MHFCVYAEIQDGCQKWRENDFCEKLPVNSEDTVGGKNLVALYLVLFLKY